MKLTTRNTPAAKPQTTPLAIRSRVVRAFTLIEILVTIGIIGLVAAMVVPAMSNAITQRDRKRVEGELRKLELLINTYYDKIGSYPPDNSPPPPAVGGPVTNGLYYELSGTTYNAPNFQTLDGAQLISTNSAWTYLGVHGFLNSTIGLVQAKSYLHEVKPGQAMLISTAPAVMVLTAPGKPPPNNTIIVNGQPVNPWRYVSSNPIHNPGRFDLWAEITINGQTNIIGNWKN